MIFTLYYMYATLLQWWRLGSLKNKLHGTLNSQNALLVCDRNVVFDTKKLRSFENLLFHFENRIGCTVVPRQKINLSNWLRFPKDKKYFPIYFQTNRLNLESANIYILIQALLKNYVKHSAHLLPVEEYGELVAWRITDYFEAIVKTDLDKLTQLVHCFSHSAIDINHELKLLKIESIDIEGKAIKIKYEKQFSTKTTRKYSHAPTHWKLFVDTLKEIYGKTKNKKKPTITIENGKSDEKVVPVNQVRPIKKESKKEEEKNNLDVIEVTHRRHKSREHKKEKSKEKHSTDKTDVKAKTKERKKSHPSSSKKKTDEVDENEEIISKTNIKTKDKHGDKDDKKEKHDQKDSKDDKKYHKKEKSAKPESKTRRTSSSEKKLVKSVAVCDEPDADPKDKSNVDDSKLKTEDGPSKSSVPSSSGNQSGNLLSVDKSAIVKPPNIFVYADSFVAKENVKAALASILNRDKYIIYDLPIQAEKVIWNEFTKLIVVCGSVPAHLTYHLLQYLIDDGQLLCLCSDFLNSVLHTFTTAEVREHELVRFSYGKWKQVKMMHHIFCYQASPAKKQFSKDSDHSNHSSNGSSPVAPRTPSVVELNHNGKDYIIQVQVLGTEETWQTPSLLLANVKGSTGRVVFSQVHLEINPTQYEEDELKFEALKDSDRARLEILKDLLSNHLELDCTNNENSSYSPGYFLGRHEMKMKLLNECDSIKNNTINDEKLVVRFYGKNENPEQPSVSFLPVYLHACPTNFSTVTYFEALQTEHIGRLLIYCDVVSSSQNILSQKLTHGMVVIPRQQTQAKGRSNNLWLSPVGSASFSLQLHVPLDSHLGKTLPIIQHIVMASVVTAIKEKRGYKDLDIKIKWPNDLYANTNTKIGGVLVNTTLLGNTAIVNIGCGVNLDNDNPTVSINGLIRKLNETDTTAMKIITPEIYFASVFNEIERFYNACQKGDVAEFYYRYYKHWLHSNTEVNVTTEDGHSETATIVGIDEFGYLQVRAEDGHKRSTQPDGNTFDMMKGLILPKSL